MQARKHAKHANMQARQARQVRDLADSMTNNVKVCSSDKIIYNFSASLKVWSNSVEQVHKKI